MAFLLFAERLQKHVVTMEFCLFSEHEKITFCGGVIFACFVQPRVSAGATFINIAKPCVSGGATFIYLAKPHVFGGGATLVCIAQPCVSSVATFFNVAQPCVSDEATFLFDCATFPVVQHVFRLQNHMFSVAQH